MTLSVNFLSNRLKEIHLSRSHSPPLLSSTFLRPHRFLNHPIPVTFLQSNRLRLSDVTLPDLFSDTDLRPRSIKSENNSYITKKGRTLPFWITSQNSFPHCTRLNTNLLSDTCNPCLT